MASWVQQIKFTLHFFKECLSFSSSRLSTTRHANSTKTLIFIYVDFVRNRGLPWFVADSRAVIRFIDPLSDPRPSSVIHPTFFLLLSLILQNYSFPPTNPLINVYADLLILAVPHRLAHPSSSPLFFFLLSAIVVAFSFSLEFSVVFPFPLFFFFAITRWSFRLFFFFCSFLPWSCQVTEQKSERA